ncbi:hypothetical protein V3G39_02755 [Dermatophilaceae bacterium Sec6.4]
MSSGDANVSRRGVLGAGLGIGAAGLLAGCSTGSSKDAARATAGAKSSTPGASPTTSARTVKTIGDGSMSDTGPQPKQPKFSALKAGQKPPQFVVISWDGAGETKSKLNSHFQQVAAELGASMTLFTTGIYLLPESKKSLYRPPQHRVGASDIGYFPDSAIHSTIEQTGKAWLAGHEIGTHFNGHFCGPTGGSRWSVGDWKSEIEQAVSFFANWRTNTGFTDLPSLPFDYRKELTGGRTPCLEGFDNLRKAAADLGWRYDTSNARYPMWPLKVPGTKVWDISMQTVPMPGLRNGVLSMDYNYMANQSTVTNGPAAKRPGWRQQMVTSLIAGFDRSFNGNRSPLVIGNHFEHWNGGIYMEAVEEVMRTLAKRPDTKLVSFRQLCDWMDAQTPAVTKRLQQLPGAPQGGWDEYLQLT